MAPYETFCVAVNTVIFSVDTQQHRLLVLLVNAQSAQPQSGWRLPTALVRPDESLAAVAGRILQDKLTVDHLYLEQLYTFGNPSQQVLTAPERALLVSYFALVRLEDAALMTRQGSMTAWFNVGQLPELEQDQGAIIDYGHHRLRNKLAYSPIAFNVLPELFTLKEVYQLYCTVLGDNFADYSNFRSRLLKLGILAETGIKASRGAGRPASLYRFDAAAFAPLQDQPLVFL
ncbi:MAG: NUDIX hydrolase [Spirulina sp. SIO3F2]|nr:NUDIX hydrolase [Spirulina sp. SIO3F2]